MVLVIVCVLLCTAVAISGCTNTGTTNTPATVVTTPVPATSAGTPVASPPPTTTTVTTTVPAKTLIVFTAASLKGASDKIGPAYTNTTPGTTVKFNLDGTQVLKQQIENGAKADVFISASNTYTNALKSEGYLLNETTKPLTSNYIIVIVPASNPGNITSLADLGKPGKKIAMGTPDVPVGVNTRQSIAKLANGTFDSAWNTTLFKNVVSYETQEPGGCDQGFPG